MKLVNEFMLVILCFAILSPFVCAGMYEVNYNETSSTSNTNSNLVVQTLKYEPYPVNAGDWFDVWIKVQNVGQSDAKDVQFELIPEYPFYANDSLVRDYGLIYGTINSYRVDQTYDSSQVILKYRVKVADNAPVGQSVLKLKIIANKDTGSGNVYSLSIEIAKTKTDFDVVAQDSSSTGTSFAIVNTGDNSATAVIISIEPQNSLNMTGTKSSVIGNLAQGDFTTVTFPIVLTKSLHELKMLISYTDTAGVRNNVEKIVPITSIVSGSANSMSNGNMQYSGSRTISSSSSTMGYLVIGVIIGAAVILIYKKFRKEQQ
jgi:hypothetical protein